MLQRDENNRISWEELFLEQIFEDCNTENSISESIKSIEKSNNLGELQREKALIKIYF